MTPFVESFSPLGYYNPLLAYGEDKAIQDAAEAGANGFIMVDLPPEEAITFREKCTKAKCVFMCPFSGNHQLMSSTKTLIRTFDCTLYYPQPNQVPGFNRGYFHLRCI